MYIGFYVSKVMNSRGRETLQYSFESSYVSWKKYFHHQKLVVELMMCCRREILCIHWVGVLRPYRVGSTSSNETGMTLKKKSKEKLEDD